MAPSPIVIIVCSVVVVTLIITISLIASSLRRLESYEMGIKYNVLARTLDDQVTFEGVHFGPPGFHFLIFPSVYRTMEYDDLSCLNKEGVSITLDVSYQWIASKTNLRAIAMQFKDLVIFSNVLKYAGQSAIQEVCAKYSTEDFQTNRGRFQEDLKVVLQQRYESLYASITDLQAKDIRRPHEYEMAIKNKERARQNIEVAKSEKPRLITQVTTKLLEAQQQANITLMRAESDARILLAKTTQEVEGIKIQYQMQAESLLSVKNSLSLDAPSLINYLSARTIGYSQNPVYVSLKAPAKSAYP